MDIDFVVAWVDGSDPEHAAKRNLWLAEESDSLHENGTDPDRWADNDELYYCLKSMELNAPWVRRVWIITDDQTPPLHYLSPAFRDKVQIVDHTHIFRGYEHCLPTFNSLSIETVMWRIEGLAEHFVYFNDDMFLVQPLKPDEFFRSGVPVLRGKWVNWDTFDNGKLHRHNKVNAARIMGFPDHEFFACAHVMYPMRTSIIQRAFDLHHDLFARNMAFRFRSQDQFLLQTLHDHAAIMSGQCRVRRTREYQYISKEDCEERHPLVLRLKVQNLLSPHVKFGCVNDLNALARAMPSAHDHLARAIGLKRDWQRHAIIATTPLINIGKRVVARSQLLRRTFTVAIPR